MYTEHSRGPIAWMAKNAVASNILMLLFLVGGLLMAAQVKQEVFPSFDIDIVTVSVVYSGASPEEIEQGIILPVEAAVSGLEGVKEVTATASEGSGVVTIEALDGFDIQILAQDVSNEVDRITTFPQEAEEPQVTVPATSREVLNIAVYGNFSEHLLREKANELSDLLTEHPGITLTELSGIRDMEIHVNVSQDTLRRYNLTLQDIATTIANSSLEIPAGQVRTLGGDILIRLNQRKDFAWEFTQLPVITGQDGARVLLGDIATVEEAFEEKNSSALYDGKPAVMVDVYRTGSQTPTGVSEAGHEVVKKFKKDLPPGLGVDIRRDRSTIFQQRADLLLKNAVMGFILVIILLALFLEVKVALWTSLGIPISFLGAFLFLPVTDATINMVSMFAFIVSLGIVVDDAIVVGENIHSRRQQGVGRLKASIAATREIAMPVTFSILTNIAAFAPLLFVSGVAGKIFRQIPLVVITVLLVSLIESLYILPAHMAHTKMSSDKNPGFFARLHTRFQVYFNDFITKCYTPFIRFCLNQRYSVMAFGLSVLVVTLAYVQTGRIHMTNFPKIESDMAFASVTLPYGSPALAMEEAGERLAKAARKVVDNNGGEELLESVYTVINDNVVAVRAYLTDANTRPISTGEFTTRWRAATGTMNNIESIKFQSDRGGPGSGKAVTVELSHRNTEVLERAGEKLAYELTLFDGVADIDDGAAKGKQQMNFRLLPAGRAVGLTVAEVGRQLRGAYSGAKAITQLRGSDEVAVRVQLPQSERISEQHIKDFILRTPQGGEIPLLEAVEVERNRAYTKINRRQSRRYIEVSADIESVDQTGLVQKELAGRIMPKLIDETPGLSWSFEGKKAEMQESMAGLAKGMFYALLLIYVLLAIPFSSFSQPFIIMTCIPFSIVGAVFGHLLLDYSLSIPSFFGIVALSGVVVNDSLILVTTTNKRMKEGLTAYSAAITAAQMRFRPILLTTLTTFFGLSPMMLETSRQAKFMIPMAISLGFGILFATAITLVLVPCLYCIFEDIKRLLQKIFAR